jgi:hypothetical protein
MYIAPEPIYDGVVIVHRSGTLCNSVVIEYIQT